MSEIIDNQKRKINPKRGGQEERREKLKLMMTSFALGALVGNSTKLLSRQKSPYSPCGWMNSDFVLFAF